MFVCSKNMFAIHSTQTGMLIKPLQLICFECKWEKERTRVGERERECVCVRAKVCVCVCVCMCVCAQFMCVFDGGSMWPVCLVQLTIS